MDLTAKEYLRLKKLLAIRRQLLDCQARRKAAILRASRLVLAIQLLTIMGWSVIQWPAPSLEVDRGALLRHTAAAMERYEARVIAEVEVGHERRKSEGTWARKG